MSKEKRKSQMSPAERNRRRAEIGKAASKKIAKSEQLNFRIEEKAINDLQELAYIRGLPVSTMIHDWVLERLAQEKFGKPEVAGKVLQLFSELHGKLEHLFGSSVSADESKKKVSRHGTLADFFASSPLPGANINMKVAEKPSQYERKLKKRKSTDGK